MAGPPKRVALVISNSNYRVSPLENPDKDADAVAAALTATEFRVVKKKDLSKSQIEQNVDEVAKGLSSGDLCMIFFAGHGIEIKGQNYLMPLGATLANEYQATDRCVNVDDLLCALEESGASLKVIVLDVCRDNPFKVVPDDQTQESADRPDRFERSQQDQQAHHRHDQISKSAIRNFWPINHLPSVRF